MSLHVTVILQGAQTIEYSRLLLALHYWLLLCSGHHEPLLRQQVVFKPFCGRHFVIHSCVVQRVCLYWRCHIQKLLLHTRHSCGFALVDWADLTDWGVLRQRFIELGDRSELQRRPCSGLLSCSSPRLRLIIECLWVELVSQVCNLLLVAILQLRILILVPRYLPAGRLCSLAVPTLQTGVDIDSWVGVFFCAVVTIIDSVLLVYGLALLGETWLNDWDQVSSAGLQRQRPHISISLGCRAAGKRGLRPAPLDILGCLHLD